MGISVLKVHLIPADRTSFGRNKKGFSVPRYLKILSKFSLFRWCSVVPVVSVLLRDFQSRDMFHACMVNSK